MARRLGILLVVVSIFVALERATRAGSLVPLAQVDATEAPVILEPTTTEETLSTPELLVIPGEPFASDEPISTKEFVITEEAIATEAPEYDEDFRGIGEPTATEEPAEGFWESSPHFISPMMFVPMDWVSVEYRNGEVYDDTESGDEFLFTNSLISPDEDAFIQGMSYDDGREQADWAGADVRPIAIKILNDEYTNETRDIQILDDRFMPDGSEQLFWSSEAGKCAGVIVFKVMKENTLSAQLVLVNLWSLNSSQDKYADVLDYVYSSIRFTDE
jgi:hypothetical protein